jgi:hypothetical protein
MIKNTRKVAISIIFYETVIGGLMERHGQEEMSS